MKYKRSSKHAIIFTIFLTAMISLGAMFTGVSAQAKMTEPKDSLENGLVMPTGTEKDLQDSITDSFEQLDINFPLFRSGEYKEYTYNAEQDAVYYNGERVKLFVDFKTHKDKDMNYAFDLCYRDGNTNSMLYLEAVKDDNGNMKGIKQLNNEIALGILAELEAIKKDENNQQSSNDNLLKSDLSPYRLSKDQLTDNLKSWINECDKKQDLYVTSKDGRWYVYCNTIPKDYAWKIDNDTYSENGIIVNLYDIGTKDDGYALLSIPYYDNMQVLYKEKKVQFTDDSRATNSNEKNNDFDNYDFLMKHYQTNAYTADKYKETIEEYEASLQFTNFTGSKTFYEINFDRDTTVGFSISADVKYQSDNDGEYKVAFITENNQILMTASTYDWFELSRPIDFPKGKTRIALIGEQISGDCKITLTSPKQTVDL